MNRMHGATLYCFGEEAWSCHVYCNDKVDRCFTLEHHFFLDQIIKYYRFVKYNPPDDMTVKLPV
jgi:hypothetical protein